MKKIIPFLILLILIAFSVPAMADYLFETQNTQKINDAITYEERELLTDNGWIRAYIAYVDLSNPNAGVKVLTSQKGSSYLDTVKAMAQSEGAALAINGDFFNFSAGQTNMLGMTYSGGELISSPALDNLASFVITEENKVIMDYFSHTSSVTSPQGYVCPIYQINKMPVDTGAITMLTSKWASVTPGKGFEALIVENDVVTKIKSADEGSVSMPQNGYALVTNPKINAYFSNFKVGDVVTVETVITPDVGAIKEATGGNSVIVDNGKMYKFTSNITGKAQRSAVGISYDEKTLILAAVDGRNDMCPGLTQEQMATLMIELGAKKAINLDGGGSTTFTLKNSDGSYTVKNDVTSERKVSTAIGVFSGGFVGDRANRGTLSPTKNVIVEGDTINFDAVFYDKYENVFAHNATSTIMTDGAGNPVPFYGYTPSKGKHTIYASLGEVFATCEIEVLDELFSIDAGVDTLTINKGNSVQLFVHGYGPEGQKTLISPHLLTWTSTSGDVTTENGKITSHTGEGAIVGVRYKNVTDFVNVNKNKTMQKAPLSEHKADSLYGSIDGRKIAISGNIPKGATLLNKLLTIQRLNTISGYDSSFITAGYFPEKLPSGTKAANSFSNSKVENTIFITLNTSAGTINKGSEWSKLGKALAESTANIVITAELSPDQLSTSERNLLKGMLEREAKNGKIVFFVSSGETTGMKTENKVRYITLGTVADYKTSNIAPTSKACSYVSFSVKDNDIRFEFLQ